MAKIGFNQEVWPEWLSDDDEIEMTRVAWYTARGMRIPERDDEFELLPQERAWFDNRRGPIDRPRNLGEYIHRWDIPAGLPGAQMSLPECVYVKINALGYWDDKR